MRSFIRVTGIIILLALLMTTAAGSAQASGATNDQSEGFPASTSDAEQAEETPLLCLVLVGGTALLAGGVWMGQLRRKLP